MAGAPTPEQHLLDELRTHEATVRAAEVAKIRAAIEWAVAHEVMSSTTRRSTPGSVSTA